MVSHGAITDARILNVQVILDLHFPLALYKKLMKKKMTLADLGTVHPRTSKVSSRPGPFCTLNGTSLHR